MGIWLESLGGEKPSLDKAYLVTGNQTNEHLRGMVRALEMCPYLNTKEDEKRLEAAKYILRNRSKKR